MWELAVMSMALPLCSTWLRTGAAVGLGAWPHPSAARDCALELLPGMFGDAGGGEQQMKHPVMPCLLTSFSALCLAVLQKH